MKIIDVNILLYAVNPDADQHAAVRNWWQAAIGRGEPLGLAWIVLMGFVRISTYPKGFSRPLSVAEALRYVDEWLALPNARLVQESADHWSIVRRLLTSVGTAGNLTTDAHLAAIAMAHAATVVSCDTDFLKFRQLRYENPLAST